MGYLWLAVAMLLLCGLAQAATPPKAAVWVASPWEQVLKTATPGPARAISLQAARNEYESARVVVTAGAARLQDVNATASALTGPKGRKLAAANLRFFREHYLHIDQPSYRSSGPAGWYPDPLIPFVDPATGRAITQAQYRGAPFEVAAGESQGIWIDIYVPRDTPAGGYAGAITITAAGRTLARVPLTLTVFDFTLPDTFAVRSNFGGLGGRLANALGMDQGSAEFSKVEDQYLDLMLAHRCQPSSLGQVWPEWNAEKGMDDSASGERLRRTVRERHVNSLAVPFAFQDEPEKCRAYLSALQDYLRGQGMLDLSYIYLLDEPNTAEQYDTVRRQGKLIHEAAPGLARLCTEQTLTQDPAWGTLNGAVDIWCPLWGLYDGPTAAERQALGERLWSYTALCQMDEKNPYWEIDFPPIVYRSPFWVNWHYRIEGFLYWSSIWWKDPKTAWERPVYGEGDEKYWGEGVLLYPGQPAGLTGPVPPSASSSFARRWRTWSTWRLRSRRWAAPG